MLPELMDEGFLRALWDFGKKGTHSKGRPPIMHANKTLRIIIFICVSIPISNGDRVCRMPNVWPLWYGGKWRENERGYLLKKEKKRGDSIASVLLRRRSLQLRITRRDPSGRGPWDDLKCTDRSQAPVTSRNRTWKFRWGFKRKLGGHQWSP